MRKVNKYLYEYIVQGFYCSQYRWEDVYYGEDEADARARLHEYRENETKYRHRLIKRRTPNPEYKEV